MKDLMNILKSVDTIMVKNPSTRIISSRIELVPYYLYCDIDGSSVKIYIANDAEDYGKLSKEAYDYLYDTLTILKNKGDELKNNFNISFKSNIRIFTKYFFNLSESDDYEIIKNNRIDFIHDYASSDIGLLLCGSMRTKLDKWDVEIDKTTSRIHVTSTLCNVNSIESMNEAVTVSKSMSERIINSFVIDKRPSENTSKDLIFIIRTNINFSTGGLDDEFI